MTDPFAAATANTTTAPAAAGNGPDDPFAAPSSVSTSDYPSFEELFREVLVMQPTSVESVPDQFNQGKMKDRITADVTVINLENPAASKTYADMYISNAIAAKLKPLIPLRKMLVGTLLRGKSKQTPAGIETPEQVEEALKKNPRMSFAWFMQDATPEVMTQVRAWYEQK